MAFVIGFGAVFTLLGSAVGLLGRNLNQYMPVMQQTGAVLLLFFGLTTLGLFRWLAQLLRGANSSNSDTQNPVARGLANGFEFFNGLLYSEKRVADMHKVNRSWGYLSSTLFGVTFGAGWVPCIGPILASILFLANRTATAGQGALLLAVYSLGLGIPFLITGAAFSRTTGLLRRLNRHLGMVSLISGAFLLWVAYLLWTDQIVMLAAQFNFLNDWVFALEESVFEFSGMSGGVVGESLVAGMPLALAAGLISFLSPCVLPLVPAYLGYLSSTAVGSGAPRGD